MYYVYIIQSISFSELIYIGYTLNIELRVKKHNEGSSIYTKKHRPWTLIYHCAFNNKSKALEFEKYLKSHSGRIFIKKRII